VTGVPHAIRGGQIDPLGAGLVHQLTGELMLINPRRHGLDCLLTAGSSPPSKFGVPDCTANPTGLRSRRHGIRTHGFCANDPSAGMSVNVRYLTLLTVAARLAAGKRIGS
jgi:hypothetical protein